MSFHLQFPKCSPSAAQHARCGEAAHRALLLQIWCVTTSEGHGDASHPCLGSCSWQLHANPFPGTSKVPSQAFLCFYDREGALDAHLCCVHPELSVWNKCHQVPLLTQELLGPPGPHTVRVLCCGDAAEGQAQCEGAVGSV